MAAMGRLLLPLLIAATALACGDDGPTTGFADECANAGGTLLGCEPRPVETTHDACWKLVECGVIPVQSEFNFNWGGCVSQIDDMAIERKRFVLECIDTASCDDLKADPDTGRGPASICGEFGES